MIDFPDIAAALRLPSLWENPFLHDSLGAFAAARSYYLNEQDDLTMHPSGSDIKIILAGVASCQLAQQVLSTKWENPESVHAQSAVAAAKEVLKHWGLEMKEIKTPPATKKPEPATLVWPPVDTMGRPKYTTLPDVYRENFYHVREQTIGTALNPATGMAPHVLPEYILILRDAYWNEEKLQWRMRFHSDRWDDDIWLDHCKVLVGDEIPKDPA